MVAQLESEKKRLLVLGLKYRPQDTMIIAQKRRIAAVEEQIAKSKREKSNKPLEPAAPHAAAHP